MIPKLSFFLYHCKKRIKKACLLLLRLAYDLPQINLESIVKSAIHIDAPILEDICLPPYYGPKDHDDFTPLMKIILFFQPKIILELGTAYGNTVTNICRQYPDVKIYTVNALVNEQTGFFTTFNLTKEEIGRVYRVFGFADQVVQIYENTLNMDLSKYLNGQIVDIVIIDACHDTQYVINDFLKVKPFIRPGGIVLFHDTYPSMKSHLIGSYTACMMLRRRGYDIRHIRNTWWGFWKQKKKLHL